MIRFDEASDVRQIINLIVSSMSPSQKTNPQSYALRLRHMLTKEVSFYIPKGMNDLNDLCLTDPVDAARHLNGPSDGTHPEPILLEC